jgi:hypothetical protein
MGLNADEIVIICITSILSLVLGGVVIGFSLFAMRHHPPKLRRQLLLTKNRDKPMLMAVVGETETRDFQRKLIAKAKKEHHLTWQDLWFKTKFSNEKKYDVVKMHQSISSMPEVP